MKCSFKARPISFEVNCAIAGKTYNIVSKWKATFFQVPLEVFDYIDSGRNPQLYTKDCMEKAVAKNEEVKGKIDAYRMFKARLMCELNTVFPKEMNCYRAMRGDN